MCEQGIDFWFQRIRSVKPFQDVPTTSCFYAAEYVSGFAAQEFGGEDILGMESQRGKVRVGEHVEVFRQGLSLRDWR